MDFVEKLNSFVDDLGNKIWTSAYKVGEKFVNYVILNDSLPAGTNVLGKVGIDPTANGVSINGSNAEVASQQDTMTATVAKTYIRAVGASQIEVFVESGNVRVRTDGQAATADTGEPLGDGFSKIWTVASLSIYPTINAIVTVVSR